MPTTFVDGQIMTGPAITAALATATADSNAVTATASTTPRTTAVRFGQTRNVLDFGANPSASGVGQDSLIAFGLAQQAAQNAGGGSVEIPFGTYYLSSTVYSVSSVTFIIAPGVTIIGPGQILGLLDTLSSNFGPIVTKFSNTTNGAFGFYSSMFVGSTGSIAGYEKATGFFHIVTNDIAGSQNVNDSVAAQMLAETSPGLTSARIWGIDSIAHVVATSDSFAIGAEIAVQNDGSVNQLLVDQPNTKVGVNVIASGASNSTVGLFINGGQPAQFQHGIFIKDIAIAGYAFTLNTSSGGFWAPIASISKNGDAVFRSVKSTNGISAFGVTPPATRPAITGSRGSATVAVLTALLTALDATGVITDSTTA